MKKQLGMVLVLVSLAMGCTSQIRARRYGGSSTVVLPAGEKLVTVTWKDAYLWCLTRKAKAGEPAERFELRESSSFGVLEGVVTIQEK